MDIKGGNITLREVMNLPQGRALVRHEFPKIVNSPMFALAQGMSLNALAKRWGRHIGQQKINALMAELQKL